METPGSVLRLERENQKKSLRDISQSLKINVEYLKAIEDDNYSVIPAPVFIKSYIRLYADALGFKADSVVRYYENYISSSTPDTTPEETKRVEPGKFKSIFRFKRLWIVALIVAVSAAILSIISLLTKNNEINIPEKQQSGSLNAGAVSDTSEIYRESAETSYAHDTSSLHLTIKAIELTWVSVSSDKKKPKEWLLRPGQSISLLASEKFNIKVGNAGGTKIMLNNEDLGTLGPKGKVVDIELP